MADPHACPCVSLPPSFTEGAGIMPGGLGGVPMTPLARPDPTNPTAADAWYDLSTVISVVGMLDNFLKG